MTIKYAGIGSVSTGTLRTEDLLEAFSDELRCLVRQNKGQRGIDLPGKRSLLKAADRLLDMPEDVHDECWEEWAEAAIERLQDALETFAPPYAYFGALEGDGADFGFWPCYEVAVEDGELPKFDEAPEGFRGDCLIVNGHGNVTCGHVGPKGKFTAYWAIV